MRFLAALLLLFFLQGCSQKPEETKSELFLEESSTSAKLEVPAAEQAPRVTDRANPALVTVEEEEDSTVSAKESYGPGLSVTP